MKRIIKAGFMMLLGAAIWTNGGDVKEAQAQYCGPGGQVVNDPVYGASSVCYYADGSCPAHSVGMIPPSCQPQQQRPTNTRPVPPKPSSYGAVAWDVKRGLLGTSSHQTSKKAAVNTAMQKCGASCQVAMQYANQCTAVGYGTDKTGKQKYIWQVSAGLTKSKAEQAVISDCSEVADNCKVSFSECSLPNSRSTNQTQQYKGLGE